MKDMKELKVLNNALLSSGRVLIKYLGKVSYSLKSAGNFLTKADLESQKIIIKLIEKEFPQDSIFAEEKENKIIDSDRVWVIDPLDGTTNYVHSYPMFCVSIALVKKGKPVLGGIFDPFRNEMFIGIKGKGAFLNGKKIKVSNNLKLSQSLLVTGFAYDRAKHAEFYLSFYSDFMKISHDIRRSGSAAIDMAWLACGRTDGFWEFKLNPWDVAAGKLIIEEAGGKVTDFKGNEWTNLENYGRETLATNKKIHKEMLSVIKQNLKS